MKIIKYISLFFRILFHYLSSWIWNLMGTLDNLHNGENSHRQTSRSILQLNTKLPFADALWNCNCHYNESPQPTLLKAWNLAQSITFGSHAPYFRRKIIYIYIYNVRTNITPYIIPETDKLMCYICHDFV